MTVILCWAWSDATGVQGGRWPTLQLGPAGWKAENPRARHREKQRGNGLGMIIFLRLNRYSGKNWFRKYWIENFEYLKSLRLCCTVESRIFKKRKGHCSTLRQARMFTT